MANMEWAGYLAAAMTTLAFIPQAVQTIRTRGGSQRVVVESRLVQHKH